MTFLFSLYSAVLDALHAHMATVTQYVQKYICAFKIKLEQAQVHVNDGKHKSFSFVRIFFYFAAPKKTLTAERIFDGFCHENGNSEYIFCIRKLSTFQWIELTFGCMIVITISGFSRYRRPFCLFPSTNTHIWYIFPCCT